jgi:hypothetical protein
MITDLNTPTKVKEGINAMLQRDLQADRKKLLEVKQEFSWETEKAKYIQVINNAIKER